MEIEKNMVPAEHQLVKNEKISFENKQVNGLKIAFIGNSITRHGPAPQIGWNRDWGMAASAKEKDYVHLVLQGLEQRGIAASACICNAADWERAYDADFDLGYFQQIRQFEPDYLVMRLVENCRLAAFRADLFEKSYQALIDYLCAPHTKVILTTSFWKHTGDAVIMKVAEQRQYPCIYLGELGERDTMKATGLFEHAGVAAHPGDAGMEAIARELLKYMER